MHCLSQLLDFAYECCGQITFTQARNLLRATASEKHVPAAAPIGAGSCHSGELVTTYSKTHSAKTPFQGSRDELPVDDPKTYFVSMDYIWELLDNGHVVLIRGTWLLERGRSIVSDQLPCRQQLPSDAIVDVEQLRSLANFAVKDEIIVAISHCWLNRNHPDPDAKLLQELAPVIDEYLKHANIWWTKGAGKRFDGAFFFAWCSLHQPFHAKGNDGLYHRFDRPVLFEEQAEALDSWRSALSNMDIWYTHSRTEVWMLTKFFPEQGCSYEQRGWPTWERATAELISSRCSVLDLGQLEYFPTLGRNISNIRQLCKASRRPPSTPEAFQEMIANKFFTCGELDRPLVVANYARNFRHVTSCVEDLHLSNVQWNYEDVQLFCHVLCFCTKLRDLRFSSNEIGSHGATLLAKALRSCTQLRQIRLGRNQIGDVGACVVADALQHCPEIVQIDLQRNHIGVAGSHSLASKLQHCTLLETLFLDGNLIDNSGASGIAGLLQASLNMKHLFLSENVIGCPGAFALAEAFSLSNNLVWLFLDSNRIDDEAVSALRIGLQRCMSLGLLDLRRNMISPSLQFELTRTFPNRCVTNMEMSKQIHVTGYNMWAEFENREVWTRLQARWWNDDEVCAHEREIWQDRETAAFGRVNSNAMVSSASSYSFTYVNLAGRPCYSVGVPIPWEAAKKKFNRDGEVPLGMTVYETIGSGPKIFGVIDADGIYYHSTTWHRYFSAAPVPKNVRDTAAASSSFAFIFLRTPVETAYVVGVPISWEAAKKKFDLDGEFEPGMSVYEAVESGPEFFGVTSAKQIYYHVSGEWHKYTTAVPISNPC